MPDKLDVLDTTFPHDKPQMLYWNVQSEIDGEAIVEITYFTSGISWSADYVCIADAGRDGDELRGLRSRLQQLGRGVRRRPGAAGRGHDQSGREDRPVGAGLDGRGRRTWTKSNRRGDCGSRRLGDSVRPGADAVSADAPARLRPGAEPKEIIKEGLSEYFIYTIEGTETIPNGWSKRMRQFQGKDRAAQDRSIAIGCRSTATNWCGCTC